MGLLRKSDQNPGGSGLEFDLDLRSCPTCRRDLHPWEPTCPDDGATAVPRNLLASNLPPPPPHLLADPTDDTDDEPEK